MSKSARVRSLINSLILFSIFAELALVEFLVVLFSRGTIDVSVVFLISFCAFLFYSVAYILSNRLLHRKLKRRQITADDYMIEARIPTIAYFVGTISFFFLHAQLMPFSDVTEMMFNSIPLPDIYHYLVLDSMFSYEVRTYAHNFLESSSWILNSNLIVAIVGSLTMGTELFFAIRSQKKAETNRAH